jgi:hypothetical protein
MGVLMVFNFITDYTQVNDMQLAVLAYNLGLLYFMWDVYKYIRNAIRSKIRGDK